MADENKSSGLSKEEMDMIIDSNKMSYRKPLNASLINTRQYRKYNFSPTAYNLGNSSQAEIVIGSGSDYVSGPNSYITITVQAVRNAAGATDSTFCKWAGEGVKGCSAMNLFKTCTITHRSGDQIDRTTNVNSLAQTLLNYVNGPDYLRQYGGVIGAGKPKVADEEKTTYDNLLDQQTYILPLWLFSGFFAQEALIPGNAIGGCRIALEFASFAEAIASVDGPSDPVDSMNITNMAVVLDSYNPFDSVMSELKDAQSNVKSQGLQFSYYGYHNLSKPVTTSLQFDLNFAAGMVLQLIAKISNSAVSTANDNVGAAAYKYESIQARLGSLPFPRHLITSSAEAYNMTVASFESSPVLDAVDLKKSSVGAQYHLYKAGVTGVPVVAWDMENSEIIRLSGNLTNNSRLLAIDGTLAVGNPGLLNVWVKHAKVINIMLDNVTIDR